MVKGKSRSSVLQKALRKSLAILARPEIVFFTLPALMVVLVIGTLAQTSMGTYEAQTTYFDSLVFFVRPFGVPVPLPGGGLLLGFLAVNLFVKFVFFSRWLWNKSGIHLTHLGALVLLIGGLVTAATQREYYMVIPEGVSTPFMYDYRETETAVFKDSQRIETTDLPFEFETLSACGNCEIVKREDSDQVFEGDVSMRGMARFMALHDKPLEKDSEENLSGYTVRISGVDSDQDGIHLAFQGMPKPIEITHDDVQYQIIYGKVQTQLPFSIRLEGFEKDVHPGMSLARGFSSAIILEDAGSTWPHLVEMNKPLRHRGYTFYQSSYDQTENGDITIFTVVENKGRLFPYIGTGIIALGLMLHMVLMVMAGMKARGKAREVRA
jgi:hypothetical protein